MEQITAYKAFDGRLFENEKKCRIHEERKQYEYEMQPIFSEIRRITCKHEDSIVLHSLTTTKKKSGYLVKGHLLSYRAYSGESLYQCADEISATLNLSYTITEPKNSYDDRVIYFYE